MFIDDNEVENYINSKLIQQNLGDCDIVVFNNAVEALKDFIAIDKTSPLDVNLIPELIILNINMPIMNGFEFLAEFKLLSENLRKGMRFFLLTSSSSVIDQDKSKEFDEIVAYITKPLAKENLLDI